GPRRPRTRSQPSWSGRATPTGRPMTAFDRGDVVRVPFPYTDRAARQHRPALVVSRGGLGEGGALLWVLMITSAVHRGWPGDVTVEDHRTAGLPAPSIVRTAKI